VVKPVLCVNPAVLDQEVEHLVMPPEGSERDLLGA
jgi:hypothetical protein